MTLRRVLEARCATEGMAAVMVGTLASARVSARSDTQFSPTTCTRSARARW